MPEKISKKLSSKRSGNTPLDIKTTNLDKYLSILYLFKNKRTLF